MPLSWMLKGWKLASFPDEKLLEPNYRGIAEYL